VRAAFFSAKTGMFHCILYLANIALPAVSKGHPPRGKIFKINACVQVDGNVCALFELTWGRGYNLLFYL
jgi:hypothetical protein